MALGIAAFLGLVAVAMIFLGRDEQRLAETRSQLLSKHQEVELRLQQILDEAVKNTSSTLADDLAGIQRLAPDGTFGPRPDDGSQAYDGIALILERFPELSVPATVPDPSDVGGESQVIIDTTVFDPGSDELTYFENGVSNGEYLIVANIESTAIYRRESVDADLETITIETPTDPNYYLEFSSVQPALTFGEPLHIILENGSLIARTPDGATIPRDDILIAENVLDLSVNYRLVKQDISGGVVVDNVSAPADQGSCSGDECVAWDDISQVRISIEYESDIEWPDDLMSSVGTTYFETENGMLGYRATMSITPEKFKRGLGEMGFQGGALCSTSNPLNRCRPECEEYFTESSGQAWEVYGGHVESENPSGYCACGSEVDESGEFVSFDPNFNATQNNWETQGFTKWADASESERARLNACLAYYLEEKEGGGCEEIPRGLEELHPLAVLACSCVDDEDHLLKNPDGGSIFQVNNGSYGVSNTNIDDMKTALTGNSWSSNEQFTCQGWQRGWPVYQSCDYAANLYLGTESTTYADQCACKDYHTEDGSPAPINRWVKDWETTCALSGQEPRQDCPNLYDGDPDGDPDTDDAVYKYYKAPADGDPAQNVDGFLPAGGAPDDPMVYHTAAICECLRATGQGGVGASGDFNGGFDRHWEFRSDTDGDVLPDWPHDAKKGSKGSISVSIKIDRGGDVIQLDNVSCNAAYVSLSPSTNIKGQCTHPSGGGPYSRVLPAFAEWSGYCYRRCDDSPGSRKCDIKQVITGGEIGDSCEGYDPCTEAGPDGDDDDDADLQGAN